MAGLSRRWRAAASLSLVVGLGSCEMTAAGPEAPFVLTTRGGYVQANSPPGIEVTLGAKRVRQADQPDALE